MKHNLSEHTNTEMFLWHYKCFIREQSFYADQFVNVGGVDILLNKWRAIPLWKSSDKFQGVISFRCLKMPWAVIDLWPSVKKPRAPE